MVVIKNSTSQRILDAMKLYAEVGFRDAIKERVDVVKARRDEGSCNGLSYFVSVNMTIIENKVFVNGYSVVLIL